MAKNYMQGWFAVLRKYIRQWLKYARESLPAWFQMMRKTPPPPEYMMPNTLRFQFGQKDYDPVAAGVGTSGTWKHIVDSVWDWTNNNTSWASAFSGGSTTKPGAFADYGNNPVKVIAAGDTSSVTNFSRFFQNCYAITEVCPIDTSSATTVYMMFSHCENCTKFPDMDFSSAVANNGIVGVYQSCLGMKSAPHLTLPTNHAYSLQNLFFACKNLEDVPLFDTSECTNMVSMFGGNVVSGQLVDSMNLKNVPLFDTSACTNMSSMFSGCISLEQVPEFDTSACTNMQTMFAACRNLKSCPNFDTSKVANFVGTFFGCESLRNAPDFNTDSATDMRYMFSGASINSTLGDVKMHLKSVPDYNYSKLTRLNGMFTDCIELAEIPEMNIESDITSCDIMFKNCYSIKSGQKALYDKLSAIGTITNHTDCFKDCGSATEEGRAELAQIPISWGGTMAEA